MTKKSDNGDMIYNKDTVEHWIASLENAGYELDGAMHDLFLYEKPDEVVLSTIATVRETLEQISNQMRVEEYYGKKNSSIQ